MRNKFPGYYRPKPEECAQKFKECVFCFDTNVLLNLYRYTPESRDNLLKVLQAIKGRVWLPHQVGYEYHDNRVDVIIGQRELYGALAQSVDGAIKSMEQHRRSSSFHVTSLIEPIRKALEDVKADLDKKKIDHPDLLKADPILDALTELFDGKVGNPYDGEELKKKLAAAKQRYEAKVPPGYLDSTGRKKKEDDKKYGDVVVWFQLLDFAKHEKRPIILITDETGEDWWQRDHGRTIGPRPELLQEIYQEANGKWFYMYATDQFLEYGKDLLQLEVKPEVIREAKGIKEEDEERAAAGEAIREAYDTLRESSTRDVGGSGAIAGRSSKPLEAPDLTGLFPTIPDMSNLFPRRPDISNLVGHMPDISKLIGQMPDFSRLVPRAVDLSNTLGPIFEQQRHFNEVFKSLGPIFEQQRRLRAYPRTDLVHRESLEN